jgi:carbamoyl-phosphate synthase large subunit
VQFGGQTPLKLALPLQARAWRSWARRPDSIDLAEDRQRFSRLLSDLGIPQPASGTATSRAEAREVAATISFRWSSARRTSSAAAAWRSSTTRRRWIATWPGPSTSRTSGPVLIDKFLEDAFEFDVDCVADSTGAVVIGGVMEHIEQAGIHSGDSSCVVPPFMVAERHLGTIRECTRRIARELKVVGLMNVQYAIKDDTVYVLEVNPRASRTVPYLSKATGIPLAKVAARVMAGRTLADLGLVNDLDVAGVFVKSPVFPFVRFPGVDTILGPEMKSTGEVMGGADTFGASFAKAQLSVGQRLPDTGRAFISVNNTDKPNVLPVARDLAELGFTLIATRGTAAYLRAPRPGRRGGIQGQRRPAQRGRSGRQRAGRADRQHAARPRVVLRRSHRPPRRDDARRAVHHHPHRRVSHRRGDPSAAHQDTRRQGPAGLLRGEDDGVNLSSY